MRMFKALLQQLKTEHYVKNLIVFVPLILNSNVFDCEDFLRTLLLFFSFCMISSSVYIINDLKDVNEDRQHPYKKFRPIASGLITKKTALLSVIVLMLISFCVALFLSPSSLLLIISYFLLNLLYTYIFRNMLYIDALCIAVGFVLRITASFFLLDIPVNIELAACTFFTSCFFTCIKRKLELQLSENQAFKRRKILECVNPKIFNKVIILNAALSVTSLFVFCLYFQGFSKADGYFTVFLYAVFLFRMVQLSNKKNDFDDPINFIKNDCLLQILPVLIFLVAVI